MKTTTERFLSELFTTGVAYDRKRRQWCLRMTYDTVGTTLRGSRRDVLKRLEKSLAKFKARVERKGLPERFSPQSNYRTTARYVELLQTKAFRYSRGSSRRKQWRRVIENCAALKGANVTGVM